VTRHVILVGLPGAGKTTVGRHAASLLSTYFTDIDEVVTLETGRSIAASFSESGEPEFRRLERRAVDRALRRSPHLIAAGAGWIAEPGNLESAAGARALVVYLKVSAAVAAARVGNDRSRPLLLGGDRFERLQALLAAREAWYQKAECEVDAAGEPEQVAERVVEAVRGILAARPL
jgi:shikimate kinase